MKIAKDPWQVVPKMALIWKKMKSKYWILCSRPRKGISLREPRVLAYFTSKSVQMRWLYSELQEPKKIQENTFCRSRSLSNATFSILITWRSSSSKSAAVYKISWKSDDFSLKCGDISIFKMEAVRSLGIVLRHQYDTTHEVSCWPQLPVKFHVSMIHTSEYIAIWVFRIFGL